MIISNCTISNNQTQAVNSTASSGANCGGQCAGSNATGGGLNLFADIDSVTISSSTISGNQTSTGPSPTAAYEGGGMFIRHTNGGSVTLTNDTITGNSSASRGGGISIDGGGVQTVTISGGSVSSNASGTLSGGTGEGGGIYIAYSGGAASLSRVTITGNSLSGTASDHRGGGGIAVGNVTSPVTVTYSRIVGNLGAAGGRAASGCGSRRPAARGLSSSCGNRARLRDSRADRRLHHAPLARAAHDPPRTTTGRPLPW